MSSSLGASADDAATDDIVSAGEAKAGRTEWEDALIKHNIMQADTQQLTEDDRQLARQEEREGRDELADKELDELEELEDEVDDRVLQQYRARRLAEMSSAASGAVFGRLTEIRGSEFVSEVTNASRQHCVVAHLYSTLQPACRQLSTLLASLAPRFPHTKFVDIMAAEAIPNYPARLTPTLLVYRDGDLASQIVGAEQFTGSGSGSMTADKVEWRLQEHKAIQSRQSANPFMSQERVNIHRSTGKQQRHNDSDDDDD